MKHQSPIPLGVIERLSPKQQELLLGLANAEGRENFWAFRQLVDPSLIRGWFQRSVASALQRFWARYQLGQRPKLALAAPPQHGKSRQVREFLAWIAGHDPDLRQMFTSYSDDLGVANNLAMQRVIMGPNYGRLFPDTKLANESSQYPGAGKYLRNTSIFEFPGWKGSFRNTTVMGQITGQGLDIGVIDDPIKGRAEANSKVIRDKVWNWLTDDFFSRFSDKAGMIFIMCMSGSTPVLMANGTEKQLKDVRRGDSVATYSDGSVATSKVVNWVNQGPDTTYEIRMKSGITVRANARHPFLVTKDGDQKWVRLEDLRTGDKIIRVMCQGERGKTPNAVNLIAKSLSAVKDVAHFTIANVGGIVASGLRRCSIQRAAELLASSIVTGLQPRTMIGCMPSNVENVQFVDSLPTQHSTPGLTGGKTFSALTIATKQERFGACSATTAISLLDTGRQRSDYAKPLNTCEITNDVIEQIVRFGVEDVFDVQIAGTENFIANGLVSHNTRWHIDDPMGRFIEHFPETEVIRYPALALSNEPFRCKGEPLFPEFKSLPYLLERKKALSQGSWEALFQQNPIIVGGNVFPIEKLTIHPIMDRSQIMHSVRYWDKAGTEDGGAFTAGVLMHKLLNGTFLIEHVARGQWSALEREQRIKQWTMQDASQCPSYEVWVEQEPGSGGKESAENTIRMLSGYNVHADKVTGSKEIRADPYAAQVQGGNVRLVAGLWVPPFLDEHEAFPNWKYKDQVDAAAGAFAQLALKDNYDHSYRGWTS